MNKSPMWPKKKLGEERQKETEGQVWEGSDGVVKWWGRKKEEKEVAGETGCDWFMLLFFVAQQLFCLWNPWVCVGKVTFWAQTASHPLKNLTCFLFSSLTNRVTHGMRAGLLPRSWSIQYFFCFQKKSSNSEATVSWRHFWHVHPLWERAQRKILSHILGFMSHSLSQKLSLRNGSETKTSWPSYTQRRLRTCYCFWVYSRLQSVPQRQPPTALSFSPVLGGVWRANPTQVTVVGHGDEPHIELFVICHLVRAVVIDTKVKQSLVQEFDSHLTWKGNRWRHSMATRKHFLQCW